MKNIEQFIASIQAMMLKEWVHDSTTAPCCIFHSSLSSQFCTLVFTFVPLELVASHISPLFLFNILQWLLPGTNHFCCSAKVLCFLFLLYDLPDTYFYLFLPKESCYSLTCCSYSLQLSFLILNLLFNKAPFILFSCSRHLQTIPPGSQMLLVHCT